MKEYISLCRYMDVISGLMERKMGENRLRMDGSKKLNYSE